MEEKEKLNVETASMPVPVKAKAEAPPQISVKFHPDQKSPTLDLCQGEYRRKFEKKFEPFSCSSEEERQMLIATGHFI